MSDRYNAIVVVLERETRDDDAEATLSAIRQIKGVLSVTPRIVSAGDHVARMLATNELRERLVAVIFPELKKAEE